MVRLDTNHSCFFELNFHKGLVSHRLVHLVLLTVTMHGRGSLGEFALLVRQKLLLVIQAILHVAVIVTFVLYKLLEVVFIVDL